MSRRPASLVDLGRSQSHRKLYTTDAFASKARRVGQAHIEDAKHADFSSKTWRWVEDSQGGFRQAYQIAEDGGLLTLQPLNGEPCTARLEDTWPVNPPKFNCAEDIAELTYLNEPAVIHNLQERYERALIYTYSGLFLVAINPYSTIDGLYSVAAIDSYRSHRRDENAPHVFAVAQAAWEALVTERESQAILVTGESGAGKTVNTKMVIRYLTAIAAGAASVLPASGSDVALSDQPQTASTGLPTAGSALERQILEANPVLEAFGNAMTVRNDNSSRFGKFVRVDFTPHGGIAGAATQTYLLEKSRVVTRSSKERSFHIFYQLLAGASADIRSRLQLPSPKASDYHFLGSTATAIRGVDDKAEYAATMSALSTVGLSSDEQYNLLRTVAIVLHLGQLTVTGTSQAHIATNEALHSLCHLLGVSDIDLKRALSSPRLRAGAGKEVVQQARSPTQVCDEIGAVAKALYERTFAVLVARINQALDRPAGVPASGSFIGVLDIAGFEIFEINSFEQLLINYTNERLQQLFNSHFFQQEQELYVREGLAWDAIDYGFNLQPTIDIIESSEPLGILAALDDESIMPKGSDEAFSRKLAERFGSSKSLSGTDIFTPSRVQSEGFVVRHYAGVVTYSTQGWINKNRDPLNADLIAVLATASVTAIASMFPEGREAAPASGVGVRRGVRKGAFRTVAQRHKEDLAMLMTELGRTQPHFVRCILPNAAKTPRRMDVPLVLHQLRCNGVIEGLRIARQGYPNRLPFIEFRNRYEVLTPDIAPRDYLDDRHACQAMIEALDVSVDQYGVGRTKVFFKAGVLAALEGRRDSVLFDIFRRFQAASRRRIVERAYLKHRNKEVAVQTIQRNARVYARLEAWPWWRLFTAVRPLLAAARADDTLRKRDLEYALARERSARDVQERQRLEQLAAERRAAEKVLEDQLAAERGLVADKDAQAQRLAQQVAEAHAEVRVLAERVERMIASELAHRDTSARAADTERALRRELASASNRCADLQLVEAAWDEERTQMMATADEHAATIAMLTRDRDALQRQLADLQQRLDQRAADVDRLKSRLELAATETQAKDASALLAVQEERQRLSTLESTHQDTCARLVALEGVAAEQERHLEQRRIQLSEATSQLGAQRAAAELQATEHDALRSRIAALEKDLSSSKAAESREIQQTHQARLDLQQLRSALDAKSSEESKHSEVARHLVADGERLQAEIAAMRKERTEAERAQASELTRLRQQSDKLASQRDAHAQDLATERGKLAETCQTLERIQRASQDAISRRSKAEADLLLVQQRTREAEGLAAKLQEERTAGQQAQQQAAQHRQELEDALVAIDQERATAELQNQQLAQAVEAAYADCTRLEGVVKTAEAERRALRSQYSDMERSRTLLTKQVADLESELTKAVALQDHRVIEHVHVLEKAKRFTDAQLSETQSALAASHAREKQLEKSKLRLASELEDLSRARAAESASSSRAQHLHTTPHAPADAGATLANRWADPNALDKLSDDTRSLRADVEQSLSRSSKTSSHVYRNTASGTKDKLASLDSAVAKASSDVLRHLEASQKLSKTSTPHDARTRHLVADNERLLKLVGIEVEARVALSTALAEESGRLHGSLDARFDRVADTQRALEARERAARSEVDRLKQLADSRAAENSALRDQYKGLQAKLQEESKLRLDAEMRSRQHSLNSSTTPPTRADASKQLRAAQSQTMKLQSDLAAAEQARTVSMQELTLAKTTMAEKEALLSEARSDLAVASQRSTQKPSEAVLHERLRSLESSNRVLSERLAEAQHHLPDADEDFEERISTLQRQYHRQLEQANTELDLQLARNGRLQEEIGHQRDAFEQLSARFDADRDFMNGWPEQEKKLLDRIATLSTSHDAATARQAQAQATILELETDNRELKLAVDALASEAQGLAEAKRKTDVRLREVCDEFLQTSHDVVTSSGAATALKFERDTLRAEVADAAQKLVAEQERRRLIEARAQELQDNLLQERRNVSSLNTSHAELQRLVNGLRTQLTDLSTRAMTVSTSTRTSRAVEARIASLELELEHERARTLGTTSQEAHSLHERLVAAAENKKQLADAAASLEAKLQASRSEVSILETKTSQLGLELRQATAAKHAESEARVRAEGEADRARSRLEALQRPSPTPSPSPHSPYDRRTPALRKP